jgi:hypothetical protein
MYMFGWGRGCDQNRLRSCVRLGESTVCWSEMPTLLDGDTLVSILSDPCLILLSFLDVLGMDWKFAFEGYCQGLLFC